MEAHSRIEGRANQQIGRLHRPSLATMYGGVPRAQASGAGDSPSSSCARAAGRVLGTPERCGGDVEPSSYVLDKPAQQNSATREYPTLIGGTGCAKNVIVGAVKTHEFTCPAVGPGLWRDSGAL